MFKFLGTKLPCTLWLPYTEGTSLYCDYFIWCVSCTVVVLIRFVMCMCGCFDNCVGVFVICVLVFTVLCFVLSLLCFYCFVYVYSFVFLLSVLLLKTSATCSKLNCGKYYYYY
jgi:hypothetical protein